jgi:hypothetical protein
MQHTTRLSLHKSQTSDSYLETRGANNDSMDILDNALLTNADTSFSVGLGAGVVATNIAIGGGALASNTTGSKHVAIGYAALNASSNREECVAIGWQALKFCTTSYNIAIGSRTLEATTTGDSNSVIGAWVGYKITTGRYNTGIGSDVFSQLVTGIDNTAVGGYALLSVVGSYNTSVGMKALQDLTSGSNVTGIGYNAAASSTTTTNEIVLGDANIARLRCAVTTITALSDRRDKANIQDLPLGLAFLKLVRPVQFRWAKRPEIRGPDVIDARGRPQQGPIIGYGPQPAPGDKDIGFISQELNDVEVGQSVNWLGLAFKTNPERWESNSGKLLPIAIKAIQELSTALDAAVARIAVLEAA